jgi:hypothetical protein
MEIFIGTHKEYDDGSDIDELMPFFFDLETAKAFAQKKALENGALFGNIYKVGYAKFESDHGFVERQLTHIEEHVGFSI